MTVETFAIMKAIFEFVVAVLTVLTPVMLGVIALQNHQQLGKADQQLAKTDNNTTKLETLHDLANSNFNKQSDALAKQTDALAAANVTIAGLAEQKGSQKP